MSLSDTLRTESGTLFTGPWSPFRQSQREDDYNTLTIVSFQSFSGHQNSVRFSEFPRWGTGDNEILFYPGNLGPKSTGLSVAS